MSPVDLSTLLEALEEADRGNNPNWQPTAAIPSSSDEQRQQLEQPNANTHQAGSLPSPGLRRANSSYNSGDDDLFASNPNPDLSTPLNVDENAQFPP